MVWCNKKLGKIVGFVDLGSVNSDLKAMEASFSQETAHTHTEMASSMLVVMVRSIMKPSFSFPIAQYPTATLSGQKLYPLAWEVIEAVEINRLQVHFITCDGLSANRRFFHLSTEADARLEYPYKTTNPFDTSRSIYFFCDVPHLLKTTRNCLSNSFARSHSRMLKV